MQVEKLVHCAEEVVCVVECYFKLDLFKDNTFTLKFTNGRAPPIEVRYLLKRSSVLCAIPRKFQLLR
jgi:hypothetical protein